MHPLYILALLFPALPYFTVPVHPSLPVHSTLPYPTLPCPTPPQPTQPFPTIPYHCAGAQFCDAFDPAKNGLWTVCIGLSTICMHGQLLMLNVLSVRVRNSATRSIRKCWYKSIPENLEMKANALLNALCAVLRRVQSCGAQRCQACGVRPEGRSRVTELWIIRQVLDFY